MNTRHNILISGCGVAGLTLARWLLRFGFNPTIIEKRSDLSDEGYMIDFYSSGFDVAEKMGLLDQLLECHPEQADNFGPAALVQRFARLGREFKLSRHVHYHNPAPADVKSKPHCEPALSIVHFGRVTSIVIPSVMTSFLTIGLYLRAPRWQGRPLTRND
jgi:hypothetical protein